MAHAPPRCRHLTRRAAGLPPRLGQPPCFCHAGCEIRAVHRRSARPCASAGPPRYHRRSGRLPIAPAPAATQMTAWPGPSNGRCARFRTDPSCGRVPTNDLIVLARNRRSSKLEGTVATAREGGVRIEACDRPAMAETRTAPGQNTDCRIHEDGEVSRHFRRAIGLLHPAGSSSASRPPLSFNDEHSAGGSSALLTKRGKGDSPASPYIVAGSRAASAPLAAHCGEVDITAEMLVVDPEQVSRERSLPPRRCSTLAAPTRWPSTVS